ncbi:GH39 family glycosyl hydrolase [Haloferula rosea]|uniref:Glycosyl hydrolase 53 family protein n=1 Tax=Haloferula rosea TaxID=490093 RepID=A0A934R758_9BACT|nr:glycosyl hydrolase 53 family protein [Haloferula rosea]MBK1825472.1 glycosyl hydrolase 53 family protein [Haloferula rosea]
MRFALFLSVFLTPTISLFSQVRLECDFSAPENRGNAMHYHWGISNRISPTRGFKIPVSDPPFINIVRPLGGKSKDGKMLIHEDTCKWDGANYVYDWSPLKQQLDSVIRRAAVYQVMIDNPPWAFQRGLSIREDERVETYGNAWPPGDPKAWSDYIKAMMTELVDTYGPTKVGRWRFCIGREIGTKGHWRGSMAEFFEHYRNTEQAIRSVLPEARVGTHFLWASSKNSFGPDFVKWCHRHRVRYDFVGVSYYPFFNRKDRVDLDHVYRVDFAPIKDIPEWNDQAALEIHEFSLIASMSKKGNSFENAPKPHQESFTVMLGAMMYAHDMTDVYRWGSGADKVAEKAFLSMRGDTYYKHSKSGKPKKPGNMVDAVFSHAVESNQYNLLVANYNANPKADQSETIDISMTVPFAPGSNITYRQATGQGERVTWTDWRSTRTRDSSESSTSILHLQLPLAPFTFKKIELRPKDTR